jgi:hypothetical protein
MIARIVCSILLVAVAARADDMEGDAVYLPMPGGESLTVKNPLGALRVRGWDQPQIRIVAQKRARTEAVLERLKVRVNVVEGRVEVATGVYLADGAWHPLPQAGAAIDLTIDAPRRMALEASTFAGDLDASGFRSGARLASQEGEIRAADIEGPVDTRSLEGRQSLQSIHGKLAASGVEGDVDLQSIEGESVDASVYKGQITAREVRTTVVRLRTTVGTIVFVGALAPGGRYELATHDGEVRMRLKAQPFRLVARAPRVESGFTLTGGEARPGLLRGEFRGGGPSLELASATGAVLIQPER